MHNVRYGYCNDDLLTNSQNYQMSPFLGRDFLNAYFELRTEILSNLHFQIPSVSKNDLMLKLNLLNLKVEIKNMSEYESNQLFSLILFKLLTSNDDLFVNSIIVTFIKKFETKKKIFLKYSKDFKELSNDFTILRNYLLLSIICLIKYEKTHNLKFLNTALKINDLLCSKKDLITNSIDSQLFVFVLENEIHFVNTLCKKLGIVK